MADYLRKSIKKCPHLSQMAGMGALIYTVIQFSEVE